MSTREWSNGEPELPLNFALNCKARTGRRTSPKDTTTSGDYSWVITETIAGGCQDDRCRRSAFSPSGPADFRRFLRKNPGDLIGDSITRRRRIDGSYDARQPSEIRSKTSTPSQAGSDDDRPSRDPVVSAAARVRHSRVESSHVGIEDGRLGKVESQSTDLPTVSE